MIPHFARFGTVIGWRFSASINRSGYGMKWWGERCLEIGYVGMIYGYFGGTAAVIIYIDVGFYQGFVIMTNWCC